MRASINFPICLLTLFVSVMTLLMPQIARADFFKYHDDSGALIITNRFEDVPKKYRNRVKVVWDKDLEAKDPVAKRSAAAREQYEKQEAANKTRQQTEANISAKKGKTLVIELDENTGQLIRRFE